MNEKDTPTVEEIKRGLKRLKALDKKRLVCGAKDHNYESHPVSNSELKRFESDLGVRLPEDYRNFLLEIGYGAGPREGLLAPEKIIEEWRDFTSEPYWEFGPKRLPNVNKPFPFNQAHAEECFLEMKEGKWLELLTEWPPDGFIPICRECYMGFFCIVTAGELRGSIWHTNSTFNGPTRNFYDPREIRGARIPFTLSSSNVCTAFTSNGPGDLSEWLIALRPQYVSKLQTDALPLSRRAISPLPTFLEWYGDWLYQCLSDFEILKEKDKKKAWMFWR